MLSLFNIFFLIIKALILRGLLQNLLEVNKFILQRQHTVNYVSFNCFCSQDLKQKPQKRTFKEKL